jgi:hypothetical protein
MEAYLSWSVLSYVSMGEGLIRSRIIVVTIIVVAIRYHMIIPV